MHNLHQKLTQKYQIYHQWHQTKHHNKVHWGVLVGFVLVVFSLIFNSAYDAAGNESGQSTSISAMTLADGEHPVPNSHPRIYFTADDFTAGKNLKGRIQNQYKTEWDKLIQWADFITLQPITDSSYYEPQKILSLAFAHILKQGDTDYDNRYGERALQIYDTFPYSGFSGVRPAALLYDWTYDLLNDGQHNVIKDKLVTFLDSWVRNVDYPGYIHGAVRYSHPFLFASLARYYENPQAATILNQYLQLSVSGYWKGKDDCCWDGTYNTTIGSYWIWEANTFPFVLESLLVATGQDYFTQLSPDRITEDWPVANPQGVNWVRNLNSWIMYKTQPNSWQARHGERNDGFFNGNPGYVSGIAYVVANRLKNEPASPSNGYQWLGDIVFNKSTQSFSLGGNGNDDPTLGTVATMANKILFRNPNITSISPESNSAAFPKSKFFDAGGLVYMREGWDIESAVLSNQLWSKFYAEILEFAHTHNHQGHFAIWRGDDGLAIDSGGIGVGNPLGDGSVPPDREHDAYYSDLTVGHNSILINDRGQFYSVKGGKGGHYGEGISHPSVRGFIEKYQDTDDFTFSEAGVPLNLYEPYYDLSLASWKRKFIYLKDVEEGRGYYIVHDFVPTVNTETDKIKWLWHTYDLPQSVDGVFDQGTPLNAYNGTPGDISTNTKVLKVVAGNSELYVDRIFPQTATVYRRGGPNAAGQENQSDSYEFMTYEPDGILKQEPIPAGGLLSGSGGPSKVGRYRIEQETSEQNLLFVLQADDKNAAKTATQSIDTPTMLGAVIKDPDSPKVILVSKNPNGELINAITYEAEYSGVAKHILTDIVSGIYDVYKSETKILTGVVTSNQNTLSFESAGGSMFQIVRTGEIPTDTTPPSIPTNLQAAAISSSQIDLSWGVSTDNVGVAGYKIYRCAGLACAPTAQIATSPTNSYSNTGLTASTTYTYAVSSYDAAGNESEQSTPLSVTTFAAFKQSDLNQDGKTDQLDFDILKQDYNRTDKPPADLNQDGIVDSRDLGILMSSWGK